MKEDPPPFPVLETERLVLRETDYSDLDEIYFLRSDTEVNKHLGGGRCEGLEAARAHIALVQEQFLSGKTFNWSICLRGSKQMIGSICLWNISRETESAEIGYALHPQHQRQGYMDEAMKAVLDFGFRKQRYQFIDAYTEKDNLESTRLLLRNGFVWDQSRKDDENPRNLIYILSNESWRAT